MMRTTRYDGDRAWSRMHGEGNPYWDEERRGVTAQATAATIVAVTAEVAEEDYFNSLTGNAQVPFGD